MNELLDAKPKWQSKCVIGSVVSIIVGLAVAFGIELPEGIGEQATEAVLGVIGAASGVLALYGRVVATKRLK